MSDFQKGEFATREEFHDLLTSISINNAKIEEMKEEIETSMAKTDNNYCDLSNKFDQIKILVNSIKDRKEKESIETAMRYLKFIFFTSLAFFLGSIFLFVSIGSDVIVSKSINDLSKVIQEESLGK